MIALEALREAVIEISWDIENLYDGIDENVYYITRNLEHIWSFSEPGIEFITHEIHR